MSTRTSLLAVLAVMLATVSGAPGADPPAPNNVSTFMRVKLLHAQKVLEGLATEDFAVIAKHSQEMSLLSQAASWQVLQTEEYLHRSNEFRRSVNALTESAKAQNLDAAALAYVEVTLKCINCHKYVRRVRNASLNLSNPPTRR